MDVLPPYDPNRVKEITEFWDIYIVTQGGTIRRSAIPMVDFGFTMYLMTDGFDDGDPGYWDRLICFGADRDGCGYAETLIKLIHFFEADDEIYERFVRKLTPLDAREEARHAYNAEQRRRKEIWRAEQNEWREDLPPALD